jgi:aryl-alcohol dehydrogenase-like predicted oxidoreductase
MANAASRRAGMGGAILQKRKLGNTNIEISVLGLGTVKFGRNQGVKYPDAFELPDDAAIINLLAVAHDAGINFLDTAPAYGSSEERLGKLLQGQRQQWVISTKAGEEFVNGQSSFDFTSMGLSKSIERSLRRLQTDYLDMVLIHSSGEDEHIINEDGVFDTLARLKEQGKIRAFGMSTKTVAGGLLAVDHSDVVMVSYSPGYADELAVIQHARKKHKGILIKKALASGHLEQLAQHNPIEESLRFILAESGVTSVIVGTINPLHLQENIRVVTKATAMLNT